MNEVKKWSKRIITLLLLIFICGLLQTALFPRIRLGGIMPNLMVVIASSFGFMRGKKSGMLAGFFAGLMIDVTSGQLFGTFALIYMLIGYFNGFFRRIFYGDDIRMPMIMIGASDLVYSFVMYFFFFFIRGRHHFVYYFFNIMIPELVYTFVTAIILYFVIYRICQWFDADDQRSERKLV